MRHDKLSDVSTTYRRRTLRQAVTPRKHQPGLQSTEKRKAAFKKKEPGKIPPGFLSIANEAANQTDLIQLSTSEKCDNTPQHE